MLTPVSSPPISSEAPHARAMVRSMEKLLAKVKSSWPTYQWFFTEPGMSKITLSSYVGNVTLEDDVPHYTLEEKGHIDRPLSEQYLTQPTVIRPRTNFSRVLTDGNGDHPSIPPGTVNFDSTDASRVDSPDSSHPLRGLTSRSGAMPLLRDDMNYACDVHNLMVTFDQERPASDLHLRAFLVEQLGDLSDIVAVAPGSMILQMVDRTEPYTFVRPADAYANVGLNVPNGSTGVLESPSFRIDIFSRRFIVQIYCAEDNHLGATIFDRRVGHLYIFDTRLASRQLRVAMVIMMWSRLLREVGLPYNFVYHVLGVTEQPNEWSCGYLSAYWIVRTLRGLVGQPLCSHTPVSGRLEPLEDWISNITHLPVTSNGELPLTDWVQHWTVSDGNVIGRQQSWKVFNFHLYAMYAATCGILSSRVFMPDHRPRRIEFDFKHWVDEEAKEIRESWARNPSAFSIYGGLVDVDSGEDYVVYFRAEGRIFHADNTEDLQLATVRQPSPSILEKVSSIDPSRVSKQASKVRNHVASDVEKLELLASHIPFTPLSKLQLALSSPALLTSQGQPIICPNVITRRRLKDAEITFTDPFDASALTHYEAAYQVTALPVKLSLEHFAVRPRSVRLPDGSSASLVPPNFGTIPQIPPVVAGPGTHRAITSKSTAAAPTIITATPATKMTNDTNIWIEEDAKPH